MTNPGQNASLPTVEPAPGEATTILFGEMLADVFPDRTVTGGAPFNVARHLAAFGQKPLLISRVGDDALGARMLGDMKDWGMNTDAVQIDPNRPTGRVRVHIEAAGHRFEILPRQAYDFIDPHSAGAALEDSHPGLIYFGTLSQRHPVSRQALAAVLRRCAAPRFLDINLREPWYDEDTARFSLRQADIVKLNDEELRTLSAMFGAQGTDEEERALALKRMFDIDRLIVTSGSAGAWQLDGHDDASRASSGKTPDIVDTVGAGDAFAAVCILGIFLGWPPTAALERADAFAAAICEIRGAVPDNREFYQPFLKEWTL
ncbi:MAG: carbohydrate kinase [Desulfomicrobium sp.]